MRRAEGQPGLIDFLTTLWHRKWLIIATTLALIVVAAVISYLMPPVWQVQMILQPAKFLSQNQNGQFVDVVMTDPRQIATAINQRSYDDALATELKIAGPQFPALRAEHLKDTKLVKVTATTQNADQAVVVLRALFELIKNDLDKKILIEVNTLDTEIKKNELQTDLLAKEIVILDNKLRILGQRERELAAEKTTARERISRIEKEQVDALRAGGKEALGQLVYSNIIQQSYQYINTLEEMISGKKIESENLLNKRKENEQAIEVLKSSVANLIEIKGKYDFTKMVKEPRSPGSPVSPRKKLNIALAAVLGVMVSSLAALALENLKTGKAGGK
ncbi:MAG: Wzz/FepE/Etk N-terminal domain-containing protein [Candidatus Aminicenantes bacterium]|nr:Wzz/FepE/Etk N-terminal domain-containing protein [Candidatus Aminicenantes bacterium]